MMDLSRIPAFAAAFDRFVDNAVRYAALDPAGHSSTAALVDFEGYLTGEHQETLHVAAMPVPGKEVGEVLRLYIAEANFVLPVCREPFRNGVLLPLLEGRGEFIVKDTLEGFVVIRADARQVDDKSHKLHDLSAFLRKMDRCPDCAGKPVVAGRKCGCSFDIGDFRIYPFEGGLRNGFAGCSLLPPQCAGAQSSTSSFPKAGGAA